MTNHWVDIKNSDCVLIIGSNAAENHPIFFRWAVKAKEGGGKIIHVDPRFNRTSQLADIYARLRPGTDIAFIGGMINYIIQNKLYHEWYVREYTNATYLVNPNFKTATDLDGVFSGLEGGKYNRDAWMYELLPNKERKKDMGQVWHHHLRDGSDPAHVRQPERARLLHLAASFGQHGGRRRRDQCATRGE